MKKKRPVNLTGLWLLSVMCSLFSYYAVCYYAVASNCAVTSNGVASNAVAVNGLSLSGLVTTRSERNSNYSCENKS